MLGRVLLPASEVPVAKTLLLLKVPLLAKGVALDETAPVAERLPLGDDPVLDDVPLAERLAPDEDIPFIDELPPL